MPKLATLANLSLLCRVVARHARARLPVSQIITVLVLAIASGMLATACVMLGLYMLYTLLLLQDIAPLTAMAIVGGVALGLLGLMLTLLVHGIRRVRRCLVPTMYPPVFGRIGQAFLDGLNGSSGRE